jgi:hypothetical protein
LAERGHGLRREYLFEGSQDFKNTIEARPTIEAARDVATEYVMRFLEEMKALPPR